MPVTNFNVPDIIPRAQYIASAGQKEFNIPFRFFEDEDIQVTIGSSLDPEDSSSYVITGAGTNSPGLLTFNTGRTAGDVVTIYRDSTFARTTNFQDSGEWQAQNVNDQFNRLVMYVQEVSLKAVDLAVRLPVNTQLTSLNFPDQGPTLNASKVLMWNPTGTDLINGPSAQNIIDANTTLASVADLADDALSYRDAALQAKVDAEAARDVAITTAAGMAFKAPARLRATANVNIASAPSSFDGVAAVLNDRIALFDQTTPSQNGVYKFNGTGAAMTRVTDLDTWSEFPGAAITVKEGATYADKLFICTSNDGGTLGTTAVVWSELIVTVVDNSITTNKILNGAVTVAKLDSQVKITMQLVAQNIQNANYTLTLNDAGGSVDHQNAGAHQYTIPANSVTAFPIGTCIMLDNDSGAGALTIAINTDTLRWAGSGLTGPRTLAANGCAIIRKVKTTEWKIFGVGLS